MLVNSILVRKAVIYVACEIAILFLLFNLYFQTLRWSIGHHHAKISSVLIYMLSCWDFLIHTVLYTFQLTKFPHEVSYAEEWIGAPVEVTDRWRDRLTRKLVGLHRNISYGKRSFYSKRSFLCFLSFLYLPYPFPVFVRNASHYIDVVFCIFFEIIIIIILYSLYKTFAINCPANS